jgi:hypothetical protein
MSNTYFCFSDECGDYREKMTNKQLGAHPFYIRTTLIINSNEWKKLNNLFLNLKRKYKIPPYIEIKWADLWQLRYAQKNNKTNNKLNNFNYQNLISFVNDTLELINKLSYKKIIMTYTQNKTTNTRSISDIIKFHLQEHMQRIQMELQNDDNNLGVLFIDPVSNEKDKLFREIYHSFYQSGDFISNYKHIKDSLNIEHSHHSVGIQIADFISGCSSSILKVKNGNNSYSNGIKMFFNSVYPNLRRASNGSVHGYGMREVPSSDTVRNWCESQITNHNPNP